MKNSKTGKRTDKNPVTSYNLNLNLPIKKPHINNTQKATFNILEDFYEEKLKLEDAQRAVLNILEDLNQSNEELKKAYEVLEVRVAERTAELAKSNAELEQAKNDLQLAQEVSHIGSWRIDIKNNKIEWSKECYKIFGIPSDTPLDYKTFLSLVHPDDRESVDKGWKEALKGKPYDVIHRIKVGNKIKWVHEKANLEYDRYGVEGALGTAQDITELKEAQKEIADLARFPSEDPYPVFRVSNRLKIIYSNKPAIDLLKKYGRENFKKYLKTRLGPLIRKENEPGLFIFELDIGKSIFEFSIIIVKGADYFNIYGKDITERKKAEKTKIKLLHSRIQAVEKRKLAEELHDTVTQTLFSSNLMSEAFSKSWEKNPQKALESLKKIRDLNNAAYLETRILLYELIPQKFAQENLEKLIKRLVDAITLKLGIRFDLNFTGDFKLSYKVKHNVYRIVQEAINNIAKHSKAGRVKLDFMMSPKELKLIISDDGIGFDMKNSVSRKNFGLKIMNERAATIGAKLDIMSKVGSGTRITLVKKMK